MSYHNPTRRAHIETFAASVREYSPGETPYDVEALVTALGGRLVVVDGLNESKIVKTGDRTFEIHHPRRHLETFARYEIAKDVGHLFLGAGFIVDEAKWSSPMWQRCEYDLEVFADALLMPETAYRQAFHRRLDLFALAKHFHVTTMRVIQRGHWLNLIPWT